MDKYTIKIMNRAYIDIDRIYDYLNYELKSPENAEKFYYKITGEINKLEQLPNRYPTVQIDGNPYTQLRFLVIGKYIVLYLVDEDIKKVSIKRVLLASSNWKRDI